MTCVTAFSTDACSIGLACPVNKELASALLILIRRERKRLYRGLSHKRINYQWRVGHVRRLETETPRSKK